MTRPGLTTATQWSGAPLPEPMRVSAGFLVTGLSGKTRIQILPPRLTERVIARRAASIWRLVIQAGSWVASPYSPKATEWPPLAIPDIRPRMTLRCLTRRGINIGSAPLPDGRGRRRQLARSLALRGVAVWSVSVTWLMPRSISTPGTLAWASRFSTSLRIPMSSLRRSVYSLSAYHFAVQVRETPRRKPYGWTFLPISGLPGRDDDRDVSHGLVDRERPTLGPRPPALDRRALVCLGIGDDQVLGGQVVIVLGVGRRALQH